ncbi:MAG: hypothetical protein U0136_18750 [Bdellovibrionota bacterium]
MMKLEIKAFGNEKGAGVLELLVSFLLGLILLASALVSYFESSYRAFDLQLVSQTRERAKGVLDMMAFELRMMGAGMPLGQSNFQISGTGLGTAPLPILTSASATSVTFRRNEKGVSTVLTADYLPAAATLTMTVASAADFAVGDTVYVSDISVGGTGGLRGTVTGKSSTTITISSSYIATPATTFKQGSLVERVSSITYDNIAGGGISRDSGGGAITVAPKVSYSLKYYDSAGTELTVPMTEATIRDSLSAVDVTVTADSLKKKKDGTIYTAQLQQRVGLRNLYLSR